MRIIALAGLCLSLAACDQTTQTASLDSSSTTANADLPPIYEPLVDLNRVNPGKYRRDLAECRQQAAPQEAIARQARQQQAAGTGLQVAGVIASFVPVSTFNQALTRDATATTAQVVGGATAADGALTADQATADYALVVNTCLAHRRYRLLRE